MNPKSTMNASTRDSSMVNSREAGEEGTTPEIILGAEPIELGESDGVVDLTSESLEPAVIDLTHHDSVVNLCGSSEENGLVRDTVETGTLSCIQPSHIQCGICMDEYSEIQMSGQHIYSTDCGHIFCGQCLRTFLQYTNDCPVCLKKINHSQCHRIYI